MKTRKILSYSNLIATTSNVIYTGISKDFTKLDIGGLVVTMHRLISDQKYIDKIKEEFIFGGFNTLIKG